MADNQHCSSPLPFCRLSRLTAKWMRRLPATLTALGASLMTRSSTAVTQKVSQAGHIG